MKNLIIRLLTETRPNSFRRIEVEGLMPLVIERQKSDAIGLDMGVLGCHTRIHGETVWDPRIHIDLMNGRIYQFANDVVGLNLSGSAASDAAERWMESAADNYSLRVR